MHRSLRRLIFALVLLISSMVFGSIGYMLIEGFSLIDAAFMSVITFSTVGFNEVNPLSDTGKVFTTVYILVNLGIFAYTVSVLSSFLFEGELQKIFKNIQTSREVKKLKNHIIVCGYGRNGAMACNELYMNNKDFIIIESDEEILENIPDDRNYPFILGNATMDEVLLDAGVRKAESVITTLPNDADNVFITLTARELNPQINVISKASETSSEKKLYRAGASHVVMPDRLGGMHMANLITKPYVIEFLELINGVGGMTLKLEEISYEVLKDEYHNQSLKEMDIRSRTGVTIIAFKDDKEGFIFNPHSDKRVGEGDILIVLGTPQHFEKFEQIYLN